MAFVGDGCDLWDVAVDEALLHRERMAFRACETEAVGQFSLERCPELFSLIFVNYAKRIVVVFEVLVLLLEFRVVGRS